MSVGRHATVHCFERPIRDRETARKFQGKTSISVASFAAFSIINNNIMAPNKKPIDVDLEATHATKKPKMDTFAIGFDDERDEGEMENFLFGALKVDGVLNQKSQDIQDLPDEQLFTIDGDDDTALDTVEPGAKKAAWIDDADNNVASNVVDISSRNLTRKLRTNESEKEISTAEYENRLRTQYERLFPKPKWAQSQEEHEDDDSGYGDAIFSTDKSLLAQRQLILSSDELDVTRVRDANWQEQSESIVKSVHWHPSSRVMLTAGLDKTLRIFNVDGKLNQKVQSIIIKDMPIYKARFTHDGSEVILSGRRKFFYSYDLEAGVISKVPGIRGREEKSFESFTLSPDNKLITFTGKDGDLVMVSKESKQLIGTMKMNGTVGCVSYSDNGLYMHSAGGDGEVYTWDLRTRRCLNKFTDDGALKTTALATCKDYYATGSQTGILNLYRGIDSATAVSSPQPAKILSNLTTYIDNCTFTRDGQLLAYSSRTKKDQLRVVHLPSMRVFSNWPTSQTPLSYVQCMDFSPNGGYLCIGNDKGKALLYRLNHFPRA